LLYRVLSLSPSAPLITSGTVASVTTPPAPRFRALDGLRGLAALFVVFSHILDTTPALHQATAHPTARTSGLFTQILLYSPLHDLWNGTVAVYIFFVLSGFVLTVPLLSSKNPHPWRSFYPKRLVRLYLPVIAAALFALALTATPHPAPTSVAPWVSSWFQAGTWPHALRAMSLLFSPGSLNPSLWTLRPELALSMALPVFVLLAKNLQDRARLAALLSAACIILAALANSQPVTLTACFCVGALLASAKNALDTLTKSPRWWRALLLVALLGANAEWFGYFVALHLPSLTLAVVLVSAATLVLAALSYPPLSLWLNRPTLSWLGTRSFSLYLVHVPVVVLCATYLPRALWALLVAATAVSLAAAEVFYRLIERPSHRAANAVGQWASSSHFGR